MPLPDQHASPPEPHGLGHIYVGLGWLAALALVVALVIAFTGGIAASIGPWRLTARDPYRPFYLGAVLCCTALWLHDRYDRRAAAASWEQIARQSKWLVAAAALVTLAVGLVHGTFVAGGSDSYGYASQALLWRQGHLSIPEPLIRLMPSLGAAAAPLGYRLAPDAQSLVPVYPPGLPLLMALAMKLGGFSAAFLVVPILGAAALWLTYLLGTRVGDRRAGLLAATLLACSPIFLMQVMQPMSDVPATTFWLAAVVVGTAGGGSWRAFASGVLAAGALLVRPNLLPVAPAVGLLACATPPRLNRGVAFALGAVPAAAAVALLNWKLYGSPLSSGYGTAAGLFSLEWIPANLKRFPLWLLQLHTVFIFAGLLAPALPIGEEAEGAPARRLRTGLLIVALAVFASYLTYIPFDNWQFVRFLLPAIPLLLALGSAVAVWIVSKAALHARGALFAALCALLAAMYLQRAEERSVFRDAESQARFKVVARYVRSVLPSNAVVLTVMQSGSLRLYAERQTIRWDEIPPEDFDVVLRRLESAGLAPYILVEGSEAPLFEARFGKTTFGALDWPPTAEYDRYERVRLYAAGDRNRFRSGSPIRTSRMTP